MATSKPKKKVGGNPAKKVSTAKSWKRSSEIRDLELPSGNVCRVKRPGMEALLNAGVLPDNLSAIAMREIKKAESGGRPQDLKPGASIDSELMEEFMSKENAMEDMFSSFDKVTAKVVVEPECLWHMRPVNNEDGTQKLDARNRPMYEEIPLKDRDEDMLYTDDVDMDDKAFIFQFVVGGSADLDSFRKEYGESLAALRDGDDI